MGFLKRREVSKEKIAARVAALPVEPEMAYVAPLASGFFALERMRAARAQPRKKLKG